jgi:asparagine synthase (glutamine-hydrolysing)
MCRIAGVINSQLSVPELQHKVTQLCTALQHGGPDDEGLYTHEAAGLCIGHRRLSILDLSARGHQPMADVQRQVWISFNGEIYNFQSLKEELLRSGARFQSATDTEVIIQAYLHWGVAAFGKLRGMFAFALYDAGRRLTYLVRDTSGIKPLYYHVKNRQLSFASEVKALLAAGIATERSNNWPVQFLAYGHIPEPYTTLKDVFNLPKGHYLCWHHNTTFFEVTDYRARASTTLITDVCEAQALIYQSLKAAVERQLIADAPIGVFLSGGIDSSLIALLANQSQHQQLKYISIYFNEAAYNERSYQELVNRQLSGQRYAHLVTYQDFEEHMPAILQNMDMPTTDGINTWFISKYARQSGLKTVLSGLGGDEYFGGYPSFRRAQYLKYLKLLPVNLISRLLSASYTGHKRIGYLSDRHPVAEYLFLRGIFTIPEIAELLNINEAAVKEVLYSTALPVPGNMSPASRAGWLETNLYMQNQLLRDTDVMSMSHGLEVRVPFLDEQFIIDINQIHPNLRLASPPPKKILLDSFRQLLPEAIWNRPKMGFSFPLQQWMQKYRGISNEYGYAAPAMKNIIRDFNQGKLHWSKAFALYQLQKHV